MSRAWASECEQPRMRHVFAARFELKAKARMSARTTTKRTGRSRQKTWKVWILHRKGNKPASSHTGW